MLPMGSLFLWESPGGGTTRDSAAPGWPGTALSQRSQEGTGVVGCWCCRRTNMSQVLVWGYSCSAPQHQPCTALLLPKAWAEKGAPGLQLGPSCREPGWEPQPGQSQIPSKGSAVRGEPVCRPRVRVWWDCGSGHWIDAVGSRSVPWSCSVLWFWDQSWFTGAFGDRPCAGMCCTDWCHQLHPHQGTGDGCSAGPRAPGEMEEPVEGCRGGGSSTVQKLQVPAREQLQCAGCWLWGRAGC